MNFTNTPLEQVTVSPTTRIRALMTAVAISALSSCVTNQNTSHPLHQTVQKDEMSECDIDDPVFIALVSIGAEVQASIECPENRSLQFVWETVSERLREMNLHHDVSVSLCTPQNTERGFAYILVDVAGQQMQVFAKDQKTAQKITKEMQESCITCIVERVQLLLGGHPATKEKLQMILQDEEEVLSRHRMIAIVQQDENDLWTISFDTEM